MAWLLPPDQERFEPFDWSDENAKWTDPPLPKPSPTAGPTRVYRRTDVLAASSAMSVLLFVGVFGYALTRHGMPGAAPKVPADVPAWSTSPASVPPPDTSSLPTGAGPSPAEPVAAVATATSSVPATHAASRTPTTSASASTAAVTTQGTLNGRFTGVITAISGSVWTFSLWDGSTLTLDVTANTQFTGRPGPLPSPQFVDGQTVAVFWRTAGTTKIADRIYLV